jgi:hypothetical protein
VGAYAKEESMTEKAWTFVHNLASDATWKPGLREIFDYRDLGIKDGTKGDYVATSSGRTARGRRTRSSTGTSTSATSSSSWC